MLQETFHTPLPLELEVGIPSGDVEVETAEGEESNITVDGDDRLLEEVEIRQDGNRLAVAFRGKAKFGFSLSPLSFLSPLSLPNSCLGRGTGGAREGVTSRAKPRPRHIAHPIASAIMATHGARDFGCNLPKMPGSIPSCAIARGKRE